MQLDTSTVVILGTCELAALIAIVRLWARKRRGHLVGKILWSAVLLIPFLGLLFYVFTRSDPDGHGEELPESDYGGDVGGPD